MAMVMIMDVTHTSVIDDGLVFFFGKMSHDAVDVEARSMFFFGEMLLLLLLLLLLHRHTIDAMVLHAQHVTSY